jgi:hypothetical protein
LQVCRVQLVALIGTAVAGETLMKALKPELDKDGSQLLHHQACATRHSPD